MDVAVVANRGIKRVITTPPAKAPIRMPLLRLTGCPGWLLADGGSKIRYIVSEKIAPKVWRSGPRREKTRFAEIDVAAVGRPVLCPARKPDKTAPIAAEHLAAGKIVGIALVFVGLQAIEVVVVDFDRRLRISHPADLMCERNGT